MARMPRSENLLLNVPQLVHDDKVKRLKPAAAGAYFRLFFKGYWDAERPGYLPADDDLLAADAQVRSEDWPQVRSEIEHIFDTKTAPGYWIVPGIPDSYDRQTVKVHSKMESGRVAAQKRWANERNKLDRSPNGSPSGSTLQVLGSRFSVLGEEEPNPLGQPAAPVDPPEDRQLPLDPNDPDRVETPQEWARGFPDLWSEYPRKVKRAEAEVAYMRLTPRTQRTYDLLFAALEHWKRGEWANRPPDKIEHCSTWLNNRRYLDAKAK